MKINSWFATQLALASALAAFLGCSSQPKKESTQLREEIAEKIALPGQHQRWISFAHSPQFSSDGRKLSYIGTAKENQRNTELFFFNLISEKSERLTFQDGDLYETSWTANDQILFTSTTDELKERPLLLYPELKDHPLPQTELYLQVLKIDDLSQRLTRERGFVGSLSWVWKQNSKTQISERTNQFLVVSEKMNPTKDSFEVVEWTWPNQKKRVLLKSETMIQWPQLINGKVYVLDARGALVSGTRTLATGPYRKLQPSKISANKLLALSGNGIGTGNGKVVLLDLERECETLVFEIPAQVHSFDWNPETKTWAVAYVTNQKAQIGLFDLDVNFDVCVPWK